MNQFDNLSAESEMSALAQQSFDEQFEQRWIDGGAAGNGKPITTKKKIQYYIKHVYGTPLEYVANAGDAKIIQQLTGQKTINGVTRELIRDLSGGNVQFEKVCQP